MSVSVGFAAHIEALLEWFGLHPALKWISPAYLPTGLQDLAGNDLYPPGWHFGFNIPAFLVVMVLTVVLVRGIRESARTNNILVLVKIVAILASSSPQPASSSPATGIPSCPTAGPACSPAAPSSSSPTSDSTPSPPPPKSAATPQRDLPFGILATLVACTLLYGGVAICPQRHCALAVHHGRRRPGGQRPQALSLLPGRPQPALGRAGRPHRRHARHDLVDPGLSARPGARLVRHVARRPAAQSLRQHSSRASARPRSPPGSPDSSSAFPPACSTSAPSPTSPTSARSSPLSSCRSPCSSCAIASRAAPRLPRPFGPVFPVLSIIFCIVLMMGLEVLTWEAFFIWLLVGLLIYFFYSRHRSASSPDCGRRNAKNTQLLVPSCWMSDSACWRQPRITPGKGRRTLADLRVAIQFSECIADLSRVGVTVQRPGNGNPARDNIN